MIINQTKWEIPEEDLPEPKAGEAKTDSETAKKEEILVSKVSEMGGKSIQYVISPSDRNNKNLFKRDYIKFNGIRCIYNCNPPPPPETATVRIDRKWSDEATWVNQTGGNAPNTNDDFTVPADWNLIIDIEKTPVFGKLIIAGAITFDNKTNVELRAKIIWVRGGLLQIGTAEQPYNMTGKITLYGQRNEEVLAFDSNIEGGNKVLANTGTVIMHGRKRAQKMTRLV